MDVDLIVAADSENGARVFDALATLPDGAVRDHGQVAAGCPSRPRRET